MNGQRSWKFVYDGITKSMLATDFWVDHRGELSGAGSDIVQTVVLNEVWEHADTTVTQGRPRRKYIEDRVAELRDMLGKQGTLTVDEGTAEEEVYAGITLQSFSPTQDTNDLLIYVLEFSYKSAGGGGTSGVQIPHRLEFGSENDSDLLFINSKDMVIELGDEGDKTQFKEIFRAAPIRVPGAVPLRLINCINIVEKNTPAFWSVVGDTDAGSDYRANKLLDPSGSKYFMSGSGALPHSLIFYRGPFPLFKPARIGIIPVSVATAPVNFELLGSDAGVTYTSIQSWTGVGLWAAGVEKTFDLTAGLSYPYLKLNVTAVGSGTQLAIKQFNLYPYSTTVLDDFHGSNQGKRFLVEDRVRMLNWLHKGRERQLRINNDALLGGGQVLAHLRDVQINDITGLETPSFKLVFAYGYGS
jgi:hypothetical protein